MLEMRLLWVGVPLLAFSLTGCLDDEAEGSESRGTAVLATEGSGTVTYPNGHPIVFETSDESAHANEAAVEALANDHRVAMGLGALQSHAVMENVARGHSVHMIVHDPAFFDHANPEGDQPWDRAVKAGLAFLLYGENIAAGYATPESVFTAWMASEGHKANLENPDWTHHGLGYAYTPNDPSHYYDYWTHNFMR